MIGKKINQLATELAPVSTDLTIIGDPTTGVSKKITLAQLGAIFSGAVSFYTNLAGFPAVGDINVIYCAKDTQKLYLWSGSAYVEVFPSQALLDTYQLRSEKGNANGYASLDSQGKVPISQLPSSIMEYKGTWNASTNTPTLANGTGDTGDVYICNVAGTVNFGAGPITFAVGDYVIYSGTIWQRSSGAVGTVTSVAVSRSGDALAITGSPVTTSGTINIGFAGNSTQYINGAGNLVTFPGVINEAQNLITEVYNKTGATLTKGTIVYINGGQGNLPAVTKALATGDSTSAQTYGIVRNDITNNNNGYVVVAGRISDLDTQSYTEGTQLYLSPTTAGTFTSTKPYAPQHLVYVGIVVRAHPTQGVVEVKIQNGYELDELHNVAAQTPTNNDGLFWEASTSLWKNKSIATILGYTPQAQLNGTGFVKASGTTISYDNSTYVTTDTLQTITSSKTFSVGFSLASAGGTNQITAFANTSSLHSGSADLNIFGFNSANNIYFGKGLDNGGVLSWNNSAVRFYTLPNATGTLALTSQLTGGTVTSVGLSSATSGVTIGSTPITTSGTITLAIATASGSQQGLLSSTDWTTFNNKQNALTNPVTGTGTTNYLPKFTGTSTIGNSSIQDDGSTVSVGNTLKLSGNSNSFQVASIFRNANRIFFGGDTGGYYFQNSGNTATILNLNDSGNLGLGVTPSAWGTLATAIDIGSGGTSLSYNFSETNLATNAYRINTGASIYKQNGIAMMYNQSSGGHVWYNAPSGTAGNAISFTQAMTLDASGRLGIGTTSPGYKLEVNGVIAAKGTGNGGRFEAIDGNVGGANITLNPALFTTGEPALQTQTNSPILFAPNNTERMRITSGGFVGINTTSPAARLTVIGANTVIGQTNVAARFSDDQNSTLLISHPGSTSATATITGNEQLGFATGSVGNIAERMRITSGGLVLVGTTTSRNSGSLFQVEGGLSTGGQISLSNSYTLTTSLVTYGKLNFVSMVGGSSATVASILATNDGNHTSTTNKPTQLIFYTTPSGTAVEVDRMKITQSGNVEIISGSIKTGEPGTGWGRAEIKIGASVSGTAFNVTRYLPVSVDGTVYYINLNSSTP